MNKYSPEIATLRMDIEREVKRKIRTPYDFEFLAGVIWERLHENLSPTTLKRLCGAVPRPFLIHFGLFWTKRKRFSLYLVIS